MGQEGSIRLLWDPLLAPVQLPIKHVSGRLIIGPAARGVFGLLFYIEIEATVVIAPCFMKQYLPLAVQGLPLMGPD